MQLTLWDRKTKSYQFAPQEPENLEHKGMKGRDFGEFQWNDQQCLIGTRSLWKWEISSEKSKNIKKEERMRRRNEHESKSEMERVGKK
jgi:hypothetical protein